MKKTILIFIISFLAVIGFVIVRGFQLDGFYKDPFVIGFLSLFVIALSVITYSILKWRKK